MKTTDTQISKSIFCSSNCLPFALAILLYKEKREVEVGFRIQGMHYFVFTMSMVMISPVLQISIGRGTGRGKALSGQMAA